MDLKRFIVLRFGLLYIIVAIMAGLVVYSMVTLQFVEGAPSEPPKIVDIPAVRGDILSDDGRELACSVPSYRIFMDVCADGLTDDVFRSKVDSLALCLSGFYGDASKQTYKKRLINARKAGKRYYRINSKKISYTDLQKVKKFPIFRRGQYKGGFIVEPYDSREKPFGLLASRTIGSIYGDKSLGGKVGLEKSYDKDLRGRPGKGQRIKVPGRWITQEIIPSVNGRDILTTINVEMQDITENALLNQLKKQDALYGVAVLMEVQSGEVKAIANLKRVAPGIYGEVYNYAVGDATEPGSTFKLASVIAALEDDVVTLDDTVDTRNGERKYYKSIMRDSHHGGYGRITVREAFEKSSNVGISSIIYDNYKDNPRRFVDRVYSMGLNEPLGLDIKGEGKPVFRYPGDTLWSGISLPWMSIGYEVQMTPMQILAFYNAIANNGTKVKPRFVKAILDNGKVVEEFDTEVLNASICSRSTVEKVHELLKGVVEHGTARNISGSSYGIAGKTGTAQIAHGTSGYHSKGKEYQGTFVGYFPADEPVYSCIVVVNSPRRGVYYGNLVAGTVFRDIADKVYAKSFERQEVANDEVVKETTGNMPYSKGGKKDELLTVFEDINVDVENADIDSEWLSTKAREYEILLRPKTIPEGRVPDVRGMGAKDAVCVLENAGLKVIVQGAGRVRNQSLRPGDVFRKGQLIILKMG
ncbi:MAG: transpeptidase family protein [Chlorobi bacterium]|nr:transpeptidase family protein [Chlorobiota bacterium]